MKSKIVYGCWYILGLIYGKDYCCLTGERHCLRCDRHYILGVPSHCEICDR